MNKWEQAIRFTDSKESLNDDPDMSRIIQEPPRTRKKYYLMLHHQPEFKRRKEREYWNDIFRKEYNFGNTVGNREMISSGTNTVWYYTDNDDLYLWGYGEVDTVAGLPNGEFVARYKYFHLFNIDSSAIKASPYLQKEIKSLQTWNPYNSIVVINEEIYKNLILFDNDKHLAIDISKIW